MELLAAFRLFADHYQFFVHDSGAEACPESFYEERDDARTIDLGSYDLGYITNGHSICFGTCAHFNHHWVEIFRSERAPDYSAAQRVIALPIEIASGQACVSDLIDLGTRFALLTWGLARTPFTCSVSAWAVTSCPTPQSRRIGQSGESRTRNWRRAPTMNTTRLCL